jgi:hypothetical protein
VICPKFIPLGVSDSECRFGAVSANGLDIDLIDLKTGSLLHCLPEIGCPLMLDGPYLLGWQRLDTPNRLRLFRVEYGAPKIEVEWSAPLELPGWVDTNPGSNSDFAIKLERNSDAYTLFWKARGRYVGGAPPPAELQDEIAGQNSRGRIDFDIQTLTELGNRHADGFAQDLELARRGEYLARRFGGFIYRRAGELQNAPWSTSRGERFLRSLDTPGSKEQRLEILRDAPDAEPIVSIRADELDHTVPELSLDGQHLAIVEVENGVASWCIYNAVDGDRVTALPYREEYRSFVIFGCCLICEEETITGTNNSMLAVVKALRTWNTENNKILWSHTFDTLTVPNPIFLPV